MEKILEKAKNWLSDTFDQDTKKEIQTLIDAKSDDLTVMILPTAGGK